MDDTTGRAPRRTDSLSRERLVAAAIAILDAGGADALTLRSLTDHFSTGRGAIYHWIEGLDDLLAAAADDVVTAALDGAGAQEPREAVRATALALFDAIAAHPWVGSRLVVSPLQPAVMRIWKALGQGLHDLGVTGQGRSYSGAALANYIFGAAAQYAVGARLAADEEERQRYLDEFADAWTETDGSELVQDAAVRLREHDDRAQFVAGVDLLLAGIAASLG